MPVTELQVILRKYARWAAELPNVPEWSESGNYLDGRDILQRSLDALSADEREQLRAADEMVRKHANLVVRLLPVSPADYRGRNKVPRSWWWRHMDQIADGTYKEPEQKAA